MQAQAGCAALAPGNRTAISNFRKSVGFSVETRIAQWTNPAIRLAAFSQVVSAKAGRSNPEDKLGVERIMTCTNFSPAQQFACAAPVFERNASLTNSDSLPAAVAEFRGPVIHGLVQFVQLTSKLARIEATFDGLHPGAHLWSVNEYGDLTRGAASTGSPYNPPSPTASQQGKAAGELGSLEADSLGHATFSTTSGVLTVSDVIGRSVVLYDSATADGRLAAAVIARSAGRSAAAGRQTLCKCDGTVVWDSQVGLI